MNILLTKPRNFKSRLIGLPAKGMVKSICFLFILAAVTSTVTAQSTKNLALAEKYYAAGDYYTAAGLYEQYLNPVKKTVSKANFPLNAKRYRSAEANIQMTKTQVLYKQAQSYRMAHYLKEAAERYKTCFEKDNNKYADALYWYAVCQRGMGDYVQATDYLNKYLSNSSGENNYTDAARQELATLEFISSQLKRPDTVMYTLKKLNTSFGGEKGVYAPALVKDNQFVFTSTDTDTTAKGNINPYHNRMYTTTVTADNISIDEMLQINGTDGNTNQGTAAMSPDGTTIYFTQWRVENGKTLSAIYYAVKKGNEWSDPQLLSSVNSAGFNSKQPYCTTDGKNLFFSSDRQGGAGGFDIWYAPILTNGSTGTPVNVNAVNTAGNEQAPFFHEGTNTLVFSSDGGTGMGGYDLYTCELKNDQWSAPQNMGHPVNSSRDDIYFFAPEGNTLLNHSLISSDRGSSCCLETYMVSKKPKTKFISAVVRDMKDNSPVAGATVVMTDANGNKVQTNTDADGKFTFELNGDAAQNTFTITKEKYKDKEEPVSIESINDADWRSDYVNNAPILLERKIVIRPETVVTVYFDFDKYDLKPHSTEVLDSIYNVLMQTPTATIQISGYTDGLGSDEYNKILSDKRAKACADYLVGKGIDTSRITFESFGACCPVEMELINGRDNPDGRSKNRRALINITME